MILIPWRLPPSKAIWVNKHPCIPAIKPELPQISSIFFPALFHQSTRIEVPSDTLPFNVDLATSIVALSRAHLRIDCHLLLLTQLYLSSCNLTLQLCHCCDYPASAYDDHHGISC